MKLTIRTAHSADIQKMAIAYVSAFKDVDPSEEWTEASAQELIRFLVRSQPDLSFVAELGEEVVGGISGMVKPWWNGCHLVQTEMFLAPSAQRKGFGAALFHHFLSVAQDKYAVTHIESITFKEPDFPSSWYTKLGLTDKADWKLVLGEVDILRERLARKLEELRGCVTIESSGPRGHGSKR